MRTRAIYGCSGPELTPDERRFFREANPWGFIVFSRNVVDRGFCQVKQWRGLATRYDKHARNYAGALNLAALLTWLP